MVIIEALDLPDGDQVVLLGCRGATLPDIGAGSEL